MPSQPPSSVRMVPVALAEEVVEQRKCFASLGLGETYTPPTNGVGETASFCLQQWVIRLRLSQALLSKLPR